VAINRDEYQYVADLVFNESAIVLDADKQYLVEARLSFLVTETGQSNLSELIAMAKNPVNMRLRQRIVEAMTTNETSFFRDSLPFTELKDIIIPDLAKTGSTDKQITIWCAASSSGQEPYSIAMTLRSIHQALKGWNLNIIASDICDKVLETAKSGQYSQIEVNRGLPKDMLTRHFKQVGTNWVVNDDLRNMIDFRKINLNKTFVGLPKVDIIFIRNVLIYFNGETKKLILDKMMALMKPDSLIIFGQAESPMNFTDRFERYKKVQSSVYQLKAR
jgi:chemotaxis protein methyltransferase CheR